MRTQGFLYKTERKKTSGKLVSRTQTSTIFKANLKYAHTKHTAHIQSNIGHDGQMPNVKGTEHFSFL